MKKEFKIEGMTCNHCVARVEEGLKSLAGVEKVKINLKKEKGAIKFDENQLDETSIIEKVKEIGYQAEAI